MMSFSNIIAFIGYIVYNYLSGTIFTPKKQYILDSWYNYGYIVYWINWLW